MIEVHITQNSLTVKGHAGYDEEGKDIVCSAATVLVFNLINSMEALTEDKIEVDYQEENRGHMLNDTPFLEGRSTHWLQFIIAFF